MHGLVHLALLDMSCTQTVHAPRCMLPGNSVSQPSEKQQSVGRSRLCQQITGHASHKTCMPLTSKPLAQGVLAEQALQQVQIQAHQQAAEAEQRAAMAAATLLQEQAEAARAAEQAKQKSAHDAAKRAAKKARQKLRRQVLPLMFPVLSSACVTEADSCRPMCCGYRQAPLQGASRDCAIACPASKLDQPL